MSVFKKELPNRKNKTKSSQQCYHVNTHHGVTVMMATGDRKDTGCGCVIKMLVTYTEQTQKEVGRETKPVVTLAPALNLEQG